MKNEYEIPIEYYEPDSVEESVRDSLDSNQLQADYRISKFLNYEDLKQILTEATMKDPGLKEYTEKILGGRIKGLTLKEYHDKYERYERFIRDYINREKVGMNHDEVDENNKLVPYSITELTKIMTSAIAGLNCLEQAFEDPAVTDIYVIQYNEIYVERAGQNEKYNLSFRSEDEYVAFVNKLLMNDDKQLDSGENKEVDFEAYTMRGKAIGDQVSGKGVNLTLRKHAKKAILLKDMIKINELDDLLADFLRLVVIGECVVCVAGITGSGKTTFLKAVLEDALSEETLDRFHVQSRLKRILICEDTPELSLTTPNTVFMRTVDTGNIKTSVTLDKLIISSLRMKPKYVVCGEIRSIEAKNWVEAANSGHSSLATIHASDIKKALSRLVVRYSETVSQMKTELVREIVGGAMDYCVFVDDVPMDGIGRKVTSIHEVSFNEAGQYIETHPIVAYDFETNSWKWEKEIGPDQKDLMMRRGVPFQEIKKLNERIKEEIGKNK